MPSVCGIRQGLPVQISLFRSNHSPSSFYQDHVSSFVHASQSGRQDPSMPGRLVDSSLFQSRGFVGKGHCFESVSGTGDSHQFRQISPFSISDIDLPGNDSGELDIEGFPFPGEDTYASFTDRRISVLQEAKCSLLEEPVRPFVLSTPSCSMESSQDEIPPTDSSSRLVLSRQVGFGCLDALKQAGSVAVVRHPESSHGYLFRTSTS